MYGGGAFKYQKLGECYHRTASFGWLLLMFWDFLLKKRLQYNEWTFAPISKKAQGITNTCFIIHVVLIIIEAGNTKKILTKKFKKPKRLSSCLFREMNKNSSYLDLRLYAVNAYSTFIYIYICILKWSSSFFDHDLRFFLEKPNYIRESLPKWVVYLNALCTRKYPL